MAASHSRLDVVSNLDLTQLGIWGKLVRISPLMIDYEKTKFAAVHRRDELRQREQKIAEEKQKLNEESEQNKRELIGLDQIIDGLDFVNTDVPPDFEPTGFTDSIRKILTETPVPLVPTQIRDALQARGISGSSAKNLLINVHKVLERIAPELDPTITPEGKVGYRHRAAPLLPIREKVPLTDLVITLKRSLAQMDVNRAGNPAFYKETSEDRDRRIKKLKDREALLTTERDILRAASRRASRRKTED
jgi:hypothetical protein